MKIANGTVQPYDAVLMIGHLNEQGLSMDEIEALGFTSEEIDNAIKLLNIEPKGETCELDLA